MNLEKDMWTEDPTKYWMRPYQCEFWRSYWKDAAMPALEKRRKPIMLSVKVFALSTMPFVMIPMNAIIVENHAVFPQINLNVVNKPKFTFPILAYDNSPTSNIIDSDIGSLGMHDVFFNFQAYGTAGKVWHVYVTLAHLEEVCCLFKIQRVPFKMGNRILFKDIVFVNEPMWERLGNNNPLQKMGLFA